MFEKAAKTEVLKGVTQTFWQRVSSRRDGDRRMWSADVVGLSVDGWQLNEDAVLVRFQRLGPTVAPDAVHQCRPGIRASTRRVCSWPARARQAE